MDQHIIKSRTVNVSHYCNRKKLQKEDIGRGPGAQGVSNQSKNLISQISTNEAKAKKPKQRKTAWGILADQMIREYSRLMYSTNDNLRINISGCRGSNRYSFRTAMGKIAQKRLELQQKGLKGKMRANADSFFIGRF